MTFLFVVFLSFVALSTEQADGSLCFCRSSNVSDCVAGSIVKSTSDYRLFSCTGTDCTQQCKMNGQPSCACSPACTPNPVASYSLSTWPLRYCNATDKMYSGCMVPLNSPSWLDSAVAFVDSEKKLINSPSAFASLSVVPLPLSPCLYQLPRFVKIRKKQRFSF